MSIFTPFYDAFMDESVHDDWLQLSSKLAVHTILDMACGTATLTIKLAEEGFDIEGLDLSEDMLEEAYANQVEKDIYFPLYQMDMRDLEGLGQFGLVMCSLDAMCYFDDFEDIKTVMTNVYNHVEDGGYFAFDVHSLYKINEVFPGFQYHNDYGHNTFLWTCLHGDRENSVVHEMTAFIYDDVTGSYQRYEQDLYEYGYEVEKYISALKEAGFSSVDVLGDGAIDKATETSERLYFVCKK